MFSYYHLIQHSVQKFYLTWLHPYLVQIYFLVCQSLSSSNIMYNTKNIKVKPIFKEFMHGERDTHPVMAGRIANPLLGDGVAYAICHFISLSTQQLSKVPFLFQNCLRIFFYVILWLSLPAAAGVVNDYSYCRSIIFFMLLKLPISPISDGSVWTGCITIL